MANAPTTATKASKTQARSTGSGDLCSLLAVEQVATVIDAPGEGVKKSIPMAGESCVWTGGAAKGNRTVKLSISRAPGWYDLAKKRSGQVAVEQLTEGSLTTDFSSNGDKTAELSFKLNGEPLVINLQDYPEARTDALIAVAGSLAG